MNSNEKAKKRLESVKGRNGDPIQRFSSTGHLNVFATVKAAAEIFGIDSREELTLKLGELGIIITGDRNAIDALRKAGIHDVISRTRYMDSWSRLKREKS